MTDGTPASELKNVRIRGKPPKDEIRTDSPNARTYDESISRTVSKRNV